MPNLTVTCMHALRVRVSIKVTSTGLTLLLIQGIIQGINSMQRTILRL